MDFAASQDANLPICSNPLPASLESIDVPLAASPVSSEELSWDYHQVPLSSDVGPPAVDCHDPPGSLGLNKVNNDEPPSFASIFSVAVSEVCDNSEKDFSISGISPLTSPTSMVSSYPRATDLANNSCLNQTEEGQLPSSEVLSMEDCLPPVPSDGKSLHALPPLVTIAAEKDSTVISPVLDPTLLPSDSHIAVAISSAASGSSLSSVGKKRKITSDLPRDFLEDLTQSSPSSSSRFASCVSESVPPPSRTDGSHAFLASSQSPALVSPPVILIKPANDSSSDLTKRPDKFALSFASSPFGDIEGTDIRLNKKAGLVAVQLPLHKRHLLPDLLQVTKLGEWDVVCSVPNRDRFKFGVISPISVTTDIASLRNSIKTPPGVTLFNVERLDRRKDGQLLPSETVRLQFEASSLPSSITVGLFSYDVRPFVFGVTQCFHCQRVGHTARSCKSKARCLRCGGQHAVADCKSSAPLCANCDGDHFANSKSCPVLRAAQEKETARAKLSPVSAGKFGAASGASLPRPFSPALPLELVAHSSTRGSYSNVVRQRHPAKIHTRSIGTQTSFRTIGTQTDEQSDSQDTSIATQTEALDSPAEAPAQPESLDQATTSPDLSRALSLILPKLVEAISGVLSSVLPDSSSVLQQHLETSLVSSLTFGTPVDLSASPVAQRSPPSPRKSAVPPEDLDVASGTPFLDPALCCSPRPSARNKLGWKSKKSHRKKKH